MKQTTKSTLHQRFKHRKQTKNEHSQRENTVRTREWERSKVGLESGILKIDRNKRVAICRERARLKNEAEWDSLTSEERENWEAIVIAGVTARYEEEKDKLREAWYSKDEEDSEVDVDFEIDDDLMPNTEEDASDSDFETDEGEEEAMSPTAKVTLSNAIATIYNQALEDINVAVKGFEEWGSYEEEPADENDYGISDVGKEDIEEEWETW